MDLRQKRRTLRYDGRFGKFVNFSAIKIPRGTDVVPRGIFACQELNVSKAMRTPSLKPCL